jgi:hypothetical protein
VNNLRKKIKKAACMDRIASGCRDSLDRNEQKICGGAKLPHICDLCPTVAVIRLFEFNKYRQKYRRLFQVSDQP